MSLTEHSEERWRKFRDQYDVIEMCYLVNVNPVPMLSVWPEASSITTKPINL